MGEVETQGQLWETVSDDGRRKRLDWVRSKEATYEDRIGEQTRFAAEEALKFYNEDRHLDDKYKLDMPLISNGIYRNGLDVIHVNFTAKKMDMDSPSEIFFAEIVYDRVYSTWRVNDCLTFDPAGETNPMEIFEGCTMCSKDFMNPILHPAGHYVLGKYDAEFYFSSDEDEEVVIG